MPHALIYILLAACWLAFIVGVMIVQDRAQRQLQEPRVDEAPERGEPEEPLKTAA